MKRWRDLPVFALADTPRSTDREAITKLKAWRVSEPDSKRQYTVIRLTNGAGSPTYMEWIETNAKLTRAVKSIETLRAYLGPELDFAVDFGRIFLRFPRYPFKGAVPFPPAFKADGSLASQ